MIDWLLRRPEQAPQVTIAGRVLPVTIRRLAQSRRLSMRLAPDGSEVRISMPRWGRTADALSFAQDRHDWLAAQLDRLPPPVVLEDGAEVRLHGTALVLRHDPARPRRVVLQDGALLIGGPAEGLAARLQRWLEAEAKRLLAQDLAEYCQRADRPVPPLSLSRAQRRWGSCSGNGAIRINWRLVMAPPMVRRSVVAHEVAHLIHFDHSPRFHALLAQLYEGDMAAANRWLKREGRSLYIPFG